MTCNMRLTSEAVIGDTFFKKDCTGTPLVVVDKPKPMVYAGFYPFNPAEQVNFNFNLNIFGRAEFQSYFQDKLKSAIEKVSLNDYGVTVEGESSLALGMCQAFNKFVKIRSSNFKVSYLIVVFSPGFGWRLGFLGLLHMEVFSQRLEDEYDAEVIITTPSVPFRVSSKRINLEQILTMSSRIFFQAENET